MILAPRADCPVCGKTCLKLGPTGRLIPHFLLTWEEHRRLKGDVPRRVCLGSGRPAVAIDSMAPLR